MSSRPTALTEGYSSKRVIDQYSYDLPQTVEQQSEHDRLAFPPSDERNARRILTLGTPCTADSSRSLQ